MVPMGKRTVRFVWGFFVVVFFLFYFSFFC